MTTKNIARTAIEGGRAKGNKFERWQSNRSERKASRRLMRRVSHDPEYADETCFPLREPIRKDSTNKLSAPRRWLAKHGAGKTVDELKGLLLSRFDTRSLAGRHRVFDRLMPKHYNSGWYAYAGGNGNAFELRHGRLVLLPPNNPSPVSKKLRIRAHQWLAQRAETERIGPAGNGFGLFVRQEGAFHWAECTQNYCRNRTHETEWAWDALLLRYRWTQVRYTHPRASINGDPPVPAHRIQSYRRVRHLTEDEAACWIALSPYQRQKWNLESNP